MPNVIIAVVWVRDGRANINISTIKAAHIIIIRAARMIKYVMKYIDEDRPLTLNWFFAFIWKQTHIDYEFYKK